MYSANNQHWNPLQYAKNARFVSDLGLPVLNLLAAQAGESILDLGCGDGALSIKLAQLGCQVLAVDSSREMVEASAALGLKAQVLDGHALKFNAEFDAVFSNAALHWMKSPKLVINGVWQALKPGGRFVAEFGGYGNVATIVNAIETALAARRGTAVAGPWYFPRAEDYQRLLEARGFEVLSIELLPRPTRLPGNVRGWLETFAQSYISALPLAERKHFISEVVAVLRPLLCDSDGHWTADYVRLRFAARKPDLI